MKKKKTRITPQDGNEQGQYFIPKGCILAMDEHYKGERAFSIPKDCVVMRKETLTDLFLSKKELKDEVKRLRELVKNWVMVGVGAN